MTVNPILTKAFTMIPYQPKPEGNLKVDKNYFYQAKNNRDILPNDLVYTGSTVGEVVGAKSGTIYNGPILRSSSVTSNGYAFYNPSNINVVASQINGNPSYVAAYVRKTTLQKTISGSGEETWVWARDLGYSSGATVDYSSVPGQKDETGLPKGKVTFNASKFPEASFTNNNGKTPSIAEKNKQVTIHVLAKEFDPYEDSIKWDLKIDGVLKDSASGSANTSMRSINHIFSKEGTYTLTLSVTDRVQRTTVTTHKITVGTGTPDPNPDPNPNPDPVEPPDIVGGSCTAPQTVPPRYEHEFDLQLNRIDARTVDINTETETDVYLKREDFSQSRGQATNEFNSYISTTNSYKSDCQSKISQWYSEISKVEDDKQVCEAEKKPNCSVFDEAISVYRAQIASGESLLPVYDQRLSQAQNELNNIQSNESTYRTVSANVQLKYDGSIIANQQIALNEGQSVRKSFNWRVPIPSKDIMGQINGTGPYQEFKYTNLSSRTKTSLGYNTSLGNVLYPTKTSNNWKDTKQYVASYLGGVCKPYEDENGYFQDQKVEGVVRTVNDNWSKRELKEELITKFSKLPREKMRAGYGFDYEVTSIYKNYDNEYNPKPATGTKLIDGYFPSLVNYLPFFRGYSFPEFTLQGVPIPSNGIDEGFKVPMQSLDPSTTFNETRKWMLPRIAVEEYSGNVFLVDNNDYLQHEERNAHETILTTDKDGNELRKWYVPFSESDGDYQFRVRSYDAGVNHLNTCHNGKVLVDGVIIGDPNGNDDYVKRSITPENPFPAGIGWNWNGQVDTLTSLNEWYFNWLNNPFDLPVNGYRKKFYLTPTSMDSVRKFVAENPKPILGESVADKVQVNKK